MGLELGDAVMLTAFFIVIIAMAIKDYKGK